MRPTRILLLAGLASLGLALVILALLPLTMPIWWQPMLARVPAVETYLAAHSEIQTLADLVTLMLIGSPMLFALSRIYALDRVPSRV